MKPETVPGAVAAGDGSMLAMVNAASAASCPRPGRPRGGTDPRFPENPRSQKFHLLFNSLLEGPGALPGPPGGPGVRLARRGGLH